MILFLAAVLFSYNPNYGVIAGGDTIRFDVTQAISGTPEVLFDGVPAASVTVVDAHTLSVVTPPHKEGAVKIELRVNGASYTSELYFGFLRQRESLLIPVANETRGGFGTHWTTDMWVYNDSNETVSLTPDICFSIGNYFPCKSDLVVQSHAVLKIPPQFVEELYLAPPTDLRDKLHFSVRVRDMSRDDTGTEIPLVSPAKYREARVVLANVPVNDSTRAVLRVYEAVKLLASRVTIRIYDEGTDTLLASIDSERLYLPTDSSNRLTRKFFDVLDDPAVRGHDAVRIEIDDPDSFLWAMLSLTDNATQHVTILTSQ